MAERIAELMRTDFVSLDRAELEYASERTLRMARLRHAPVLGEGGRLAGVVSYRDLVEAIRARLEKELGLERVEALLGEPLREIGRTRVVTVDPDCPPARAARLMLRYGIGFLPVVDAEGRLLGIVTESDLLRAAYAAGS